MNKSMFSVLAALCAASFGAVADTVMTDPVQLSGVSYYQSRETQKVHVSYTLSNQDDEPAYVVMDVLTNGVSIGLQNVKTFETAGTASQLDGDPVACGTHEIVWNARKDWRGNLSTNAVVQLSAFYTNRFDLYMVVDLSGGPSAERFPVSFTTVEPDPDADYSCISNKLYLKRVNAGTFTMGSPTTETGRNSDEPQHQVTLTRPFFASVYPVTVAQYALVTGNTQKFSSADATAAAFTPASASWNDCRGASSAASWPSSDDVEAGSFMGLIRAKTGISGFDLPTEAQWEYTCRAGTTTSLNNGTDCTVSPLTPASSGAADPNLDLLGWYNQNSGSKIRAVGQKQPNAWGFYDFHGNTFEICLDAKNNSLGTSPVTDPKFATDYQGKSGTATGWRVSRGGWFAYNGAWSRSSMRNSTQPDSRTVTALRLWCNL